MESSVAEIIPPPVSAASLVGGELGSSIDLASSSSNSSNNGLSTTIAIAITSINETKTTTTSSASMSDGKQRIVDFIRKELQDGIDEAMAGIKEWKPSEDHPDAKKPRMIDMDVWATYPFPKKMQNRYGVKFIEFTTFVHTYDGNIDSKDTSFTSELSYAGYCGEDATHNNLCDTLEETVDAFLHTFNNSYFCHKCKVVNFKLKNYNPFSSNSSSSSENPIHNMVCPKCTFYIEASSLCEERDKLLRECSICYVTDIPSVKAGKLTCTGAAKHYDFICRACLLKNGGICPQCREPPIRTAWTEDDEEDPIDLGDNCDSEDDDDDDDSSYDGDDSAGTIMEEVE